jgi:hypothetical protein
MCAACLKGVHSCFSKNCICEKCWEAV